MGGPVRGKRALEHVAERELAESPGRSVEGDEDPFVANPEIARSRLEWRTCSGGRRAAGGDVQERAGEGGPARGAEARLQIDRARQAVGVELRVDVAQGRGSGEGGDGQGFDERPACALLGDHGQHHDSAGPQRRGEALVVLRHSGLGEGHVVGDGGDARGGQLFDELSMNAARPRPAAEGGQARLVDPHHDHVRGRRLEEGPAGRVVEHEIDPPEPVEVGQQGRETGHDNRCDHAARLPESGARVRHNVRSPSRTVAAGSK